LLYESSRVHPNSNSQSGSSLGSVRVHSLILSYTLGSMRCDSQASFLARTLASPYLGREPKARVVIVLTCNRTSKLNCLLSKEVVAPQEASHYHILLKETITHQNSIGYHLLSREVTIHQDSTYYHMLSKEEKELERTMEVEVHFIKERTLPTSTKSCFMITKG